MKKPTKSNCTGEGKIHKFEPEEEEIEDISMDEEDVGVEVEEVEAQGADPITWLPEYVPPRKGNTKVPKDINESKTPLQTPLLPDGIVFEGLRLARVPMLKLED